MHGCCDSAAATVEVLVVHDTLLEGFDFLLEVERNNRRHLLAVARIFSLRSCEAAADNEEAAADTEATRLDAEMAHRVAGAVRAGRPRSRRWNSEVLQHGAAYLVR